MLRDLVCHCSFSMNILSYSVQNVPGSDKFVKKLGDFARATLKLVSLSLLIFPVSLLLD